MKQHKGSVTVEVEHQIATSTTTCLNLKADNIEGTLPGQPQELRKGPGTGCRKEILRTDQPDTIPEPGIKEIKRVELYSKYRPLLPEEFQDETPYPGKMSWTESRQKRMLQQENELQSNERTQSKKAWNLFFPTTRSYVGSSLSLY